jgi:hypothetical protein
MALEQLMGEAADKLSIKIGLQLFWPASGVDEEFPKSVMNVSSARALGFCLHCSAPG